MKIRVGGTGNRSVGAILAKSREGDRARRKNRIGHKGTIVVKNLSKVPQVFQRG